MKERAREKKRDGEIEGKRQMVFIIALDICNFLLHCKKIVLIKNNMAKLSAEMFTLNSLFAFIGA